MANINDFYELQETCGTLTCMIKDQVDFVSDLLGSIGFRLLDEETGDTIVAAPFAIDNVDSAVTNVKQLSSKADKLVAKVQEFSKLVHAIADKQ